MATASSPIKKRSREDGDMHRENDADRHRDGISTSNSGLHRSKSSPNSKKNREGKNADLEDGENGALKEDAHRSAHAELITAQEHLPFQSGPIQVLHFGKLQPSSPPFHTPVNLYPVGYKSEVTVEHRESPFQPSSKETVLCEVLELDGSPEFVLTVQSSGRVFIAPTEDDVWKKFEEKHSVEQSPSFFNLAIELLLEGLEGATACSRYLFHCQRGYGTDYFTDEQALLASTLFMPRKSRHSRSRHRRSLSAADNKVINEVRKKQKALEEEQKKAQAKKEKEERAHERELKEKQKEEERAQRAREKAVRSVERNEKKEAERLLREQDRAARKAEGGKSQPFSALSARGVVAEQKRARSEAAALVLQSFDEEEEQEARDLMTLCLLSARVGDDGSGGSGPCDKNEDPQQVSSVSGTLSTSPSSSLDSFLNDIPSFQEELCVSDDSDVEQILDAFNCLYSLRTLLGISGDLTLDKFIRNILGNPMTSVVAGAVTETGGEREDSAEQEMPEQGQVSFKLAITHYILLGIPLIALSHTTLKQGQDAAELDRIQLNLLRALLPDLHTRFSLDEDGEGGAAGSTKKGSKDKDMPSNKTSFPLNQLTWPELARLLLLEFVDIEMERGDEQIVHTLRGSKSTGSSSFKSNKNIMKNLRCRLATRHLAAAAHCEDKFVTLGAAARASGEKEDQEDLLLQASLPSPPASQSQDVITSSRQASEQLFDFTSEAEVMTAVAEASLLPSEATVVASAAVSEEAKESEAKTAVEETKKREVDVCEDYRRCCKVWTKIMSLSQARALLWEVDENTCPGYLVDIRRPLSLVNVAYKLLQRSYPAGEDVGDGVGSVAACFYRDMRQVFVNCICFNSEATALYSHGQKLLQVLHRHMNEWVFSPSRPPVEQCEEGFCLQSQTPLPLSRERGEYSSVKCGRCAGVYSLDTLQQLEGQVGVLQPSEEEVLQSHDDWICFLCLREDSVATAPVLANAFASNVISPPALSGPHADPAFRVNEWGASSTLPWHLNTQHIEQLDQFTDDMPTLPAMVEAVAIMSAPTLTPLLPLDNICDFEDNLSGQRKLLPWTMRERLKVYAALCELLKSHEASHDFMTDLYTQCTKLTKMSVAESFCEADFIEQVKRVAGGAGVALCRSLLDGVEEDSEAAKQLKVIEGRCIHCRGSTFEENLAANDDVLLCDGCNAEAHLSCLPIDRVPSGEWYCGPCAERISSREAEDDIGTVDITSHRRLDLEAALQEELTRLQKEGEPLPIPQSGHSCAYCGGSELDLCSPLVYGQSREEFNEHVKECDTDTAAATVVPFFPLVSDPKSAKMVLSNAGGSDISSKKRKGFHFPVVSCPVVHEVCALNMCQARMQRSRHALRRKRKVIADRVADMSYISSRPLGNDSSGRFYWQFPNSDNSLFISPPSLMSEREPDKEALSDMMQSQRDGLKKGKRGTPMKKRVRVEGNQERTALFSQSSSLESQEESSGKDNNKWLRVKGLDDVAKVIELLAQVGGEAEKSLCHVLSTLYHADITKHHEDKEKEPVSGGVELATVPEEGEMSKAEGKDEGCEKASDELVKQSDVGGEGDGSTAEIKTSENSDEALSKPQFSEFAFKDEDEVKVEQEEEEEEEEEWDYGRRRPPRRAAAPIVPRLKPGEGVPVSMALLSSLGPEILPEYVIKKEKVFEDRALRGDESDDEEEDLSYQRHFVFSRSSKFFAIALRDCYDTPCKLGKRFTINFQIHYEEDEEPLACTLLREPWEDGVYYFATLNFKRSGKYTLSFLAEGAKATNISPLMFTVRVRAEHVSLGAECALDSLRAYSFIAHGERHITHRRREVAVELNRTDNEFSAVKSCLLAVYLALPLGALSMGYTEEDQSGNSEMVVRATGWNSNLDQVWRASVLAASCSTSLMECALLLEHYIHKNWLLWPHSKLLSALPSAHFAMRCSTLSAVSLRVFCLDKALAYDRVQEISRSSRVGDVARKSSGGGRGGSKKDEKPRRSRSSQAAKRGLERLEATALVDEVNFVGGYGESIGSSRPRRAAMTKARENISQSVKQHYEGIDEEEEWGGRKRRGLHEQSDSGEWTCPACTFVNASRARSCQTCSERKPRGSGEVMTAEGRALKQSMSREERMKKRRGMYAEEQEFEDDSEEESEEDDEEEQVRERSTRKRSRVQSYADDDDNEDVADDAENKGRTKSKRIERGMDEGIGINEGSEEQDHTVEFSVDLEGMLAARRSQLGQQQGEISDDVLQMLKVLQELQGDPTSLPFWEPVDEEYYVDYRDKVDEPADLGSIARRVSVGFYAHPKEFAEDVRLVWKNCLAYNQEDSEIYGNAKVLGRFFEEMFAQIKTGSVTDPSSTSSNSGTNTTVGANTIDKDSSAVVGEITSEEALGGGVSSAVNAAGTAVTPTADL